jgi:ABC-type phosphate transport system substrate-binding protein
MGVAERIDLRRAIGRADREPSEGRLQRLQQGLAQIPAGGDGQVGIVGEIAHALDHRDLAVEEFAHEEA